MPSSPSPELCRKEKAVPPPSLFQNGNIVIQTHHIGWIITGCFTIVAMVISFWLVNRHLQWYTNKREQRYIVRILFLVPLYAIISLASYLWWNHATPLILIRDGYESTVLTAFFYLLLMYLSPNVDEQRLIFMKHGLSRQNDAERTKKGESLQRWVFPLGFIRWKPVDGLYFLQLMKWGVLQYCVLRPLTTLSAVILDYMGLYCETSWGLGWGHIYITIIVSLSVTVAMYCLIQLYVAVSKDLAKHKPLLKLVAIKAVVFLTFWQATFLSVLSMFGVVKDTQYMTAEDINIGIGALLETFEMVLFALLHVWAFTYKVYQLPHDPNSGLPPPERTPRLKSLGHAMDFRETFRELWVGCIYMWHKFRGKEPVMDTGAIRASYYEGVFGKQRPTQRPRHANHDDGSDDDNIDLKQPTLPQVQVEVTERVEVDIGGEKQWLGIGDNYGYGLKFLRRERSEGLEEQIEKELEKRGYTLRNEDDADLQQPKHPKQKSWWRSIYNRISQSGHDEPRQVEEGLSANVPLNHKPSRKRMARRSHSKSFSMEGDATRRLLAPADVNAARIDLEDHPPPSLITRKNRRELRGSVDKWRQNVGPQIGNEDVLMPLPTPAQGYLDYRRTGGRGHGHIVRDYERGHHLPVLPGASSSPISLAIVDPRQQLQTPLRSPDSQGRLERMFKSAMNDPPAEINQAPTDTAWSETSSVGGYRLTKTTLPVSLAPSQPSIIPANQLGMTVQRRSTQYYLADGDVHVPMTADVVDVGGYVAEGKDDYGDAVVPTSVRAHRRESPSSRNHYPDPEDFPMPPGTASTTPTRQPLPQQQPQAGPSTSPTPSPSPRPPTALRRSSAQYYPNSKSPTSRNRQSLPLNIDIPYSSSVSHPISPNKWQPHHTRQGCYLNETSSASIVHSSTQRVSSVSTSPRNPKFLPAINPPVSSIDDGLSRYPINISSAHPVIPRHS